MARGSLLILYITHSVILMLQAIWLLRYLGAIEHYPLPKKYKMRDPNKAKWPAWTRVSRCQLNWLWTCFSCKCWDLFVCIYWNNYSFPSRWTVADYLPKFQRIIVQQLFIKLLLSTNLLTWLLMIIIHWSKWWCSMVEVLYNCAKGVALLR